MRGDRQWQIIQDSAGGRSKQTDIAGRSTLNRRARSAVAKDNTCSFCGMVSHIANGILTQCVDMTIRIADSLQSLRLHLLASLIPPY